MSFRSCMVATKCPHHDIDAAGPKLSRNGEFSSASQRSPQNEIDMDEIIYVFLSAVLSKLRVR